MYKPSQSSKTTYTKRKIRQKQTFHLKVHCNNTAITDLIKGKAKTYHTIRTVPKSYRKIVSMYDFTFCQHHLYILCQRTL
jgi:hypothetical protein